VDYIKNNFADFSLKQLINFNIISGALQNNKLNNMLGFKRGEERMQ